MKLLKKTFDIITIITLLILPCTKIYSQVYELTDINQLQSGDEIIIVDKVNKVAIENTAISVNPKAIDVSAFLNGDKISLTSVSNIQWIITIGETSEGVKYYSFNAPGTDNFLLVKNDAQGVSVGTKKTGTYEDTYYWISENFLLQATMANNITSRYLSFSNANNNDWRAYSTTTNLTKTTFYKRTKKITNIKYETDYFTIKVGDSFTVPTLIYPDNLTGITYSMICTPMYSTDNAESMGTINSSTGELSLGNIPGTIVVTAYFPGNDTYDEASASYTINILDPDYVPANYTKITSTDNLYAGGIYMIVCEESKKAMAKISGNYGNAIDISIDNDMATTDITNDTNNPYEITLGGEPDAYTFTTLQGKIGWTSGGVYFNTSSNQKWEITFDESFNALIDNAANTQNNRNISYNKDNETSGPFRVYTKAYSETCDKVQLYRRNIIKVGSDGYATLCNDMPFIMPKGVSGAVITSVNSQSGALSIDYRYPEGSTVPAYTPLLLKASEGNYDFLTVTSTDAIVPNDNILRGRKDIDSNGKTYAGEGEYKYYILSHSKVGERFGFFWAAANGGAINYVAPYAYLAIKLEGNSDAPSMFSIEGDGTSTGITNLENTKKETNNSPIYNLSGQRVKKEYRGMIIKNNKKYVAR